MLRLNQLSEKAKKLRLRENCRIIKKHRFICKLEVSEECIEVNFSEFEYGIALFCHYSC